MSNTIKSTKTANNHFTVDFINGTIVGTKTSFDRAGKGMKPYYQELIKLMNAHPTFQCAAKVQEKKSRKQKVTYHGLTFKFMEAYISLQKNSARLLVDYSAVKAFAKKAGIGIYPTTKKWFLHEFDSDNEGFDMKKAWEEIKAAGLADAILNAEEPTQDENDSAVILPKTA